MPSRSLSILAALLSLLFSGRLAAQATESQSAPAQPAPAQSTSKDSPERQHALELYHAGKFVEAMPLLEQLSADHPNDLVVKESWAFSVMAYADTLSDPDLRKKARVRARSIALQAKQQGDNSSLLQIILELPENGSQPAFSDRKEVDDAMKTAEADFVRGDFDKAREGYLRVLILDPKNYEAALFMGDVYFKQNIYGSAGEWFARAIEIDPNRETAYRYWGDALWAMGKSAEARGKYIEAVIAEPYNNQRSWMGLNQWAQRTKVTLNWVRLQDKAAVTQKDDTHVNITLDPGSGKDDPSAAGWTGYAISRAAWRGDKFKKEFPSEPKYRHTLREEADSLHLMVEILSRPENLPRLDASLAALVKIDQAGLIEPFALLNRADGEIAQDYAPYRSAHRDTLYRYFDEYVVPKAPPR
ncbi:MAG: tetratricopeptide repeat protein [Candidatus Sulfotelmatobacter sp.]